MKSVTLNVPEYVYEFYWKMGLSAGLPVEQVMSDSLFLMAGKSSVKAIERKTHKKKGSS